MKITEKLAGTTTLPRQEPTTAEASSQLPAVDERGEKISVHIPKLFEPANGYNRSAAKFAPTVNEHEIYLANNTQCPVNISAGSGTKTHRTASRSTISLPRRTINYGFRLTTNGNILLDTAKGRIDHFPITGALVILYDEDGNASPMRLKAHLRWDTQKQKLFIDKKEVKSAKLIKENGSYRFHIDQQELNRLLESYVLSVLYAYSLRTSHTEYATMNRNLKRVEEVISELHTEKRLTADIKKKLYNDILKIKTGLKKDEAFLDDVAKKLRTWKSQSRNYTEDFKEDLTEFEQRLNLAKKELSSLKTRLNAILWKWWYRFIKQPRRASGC